jgi:hypothetical protein
MHCVTICVRDGAFYKAIDLMVANVFIGKRPKGYKLVHLDGNPFNNQVTNLAYVIKDYSPSEITQKNE